MADCPSTFHAPVERSSSAELASQVGALAESRALTELLHCVPDGVLVLNECRQLLYANRAALRLVGAKDLAAVIGQRPGEFLSCVHSEEPQGGCGTTRFCRHCGAVNAILAKSAGQATVEECRLWVRRSEGEIALDLRVWATVVRFGAFEFTFFAFLDIADEKRRLFLERIFLHDLGNTTSALKGFLALLGATAEHAAQREHYLRRMDAISDQMLEDIHTQHILIAAEAGDLERHPLRLSSRAMLKEVLACYDRPTLLNGRKLVLAPDLQDIAFESDPALLARVLANMVKNAIEGSAPGESVTVGCALRGAEVCFHVHNATYMPENIRLQVFTRSFSTKGPGRGLGTYSMKFLTEHYLGGRISFVSTEAAGTVFTACYPLGG